MHKPVTKDRASLIRIMHATLKKFDGNQFCTWKDVPPKHIYKVDQELWDGELSLSACLGGGE